MKIEVAERYPEMTFQDYTDDRQTEDDLPENDAWYVTNASHDSFTSIDNRRHILSAQRRSRWQPRGHVRKREEIHRYEIRKPHKKTHGVGMAVACCCQRCLPLGGGVLLEDGREEETKPDTNKSHRRTRTKHSFFPRIQLQYLWDIQSQKS